TSDERDPAKYAADCNELLGLKHSCACYLLLTMLERSCIITLMNKLSNERRTQIVRALVEGNSIRSTCRMTDTAKATVLKLLVEIGAACDAYQREHMRNLSCKRVQCDEIWSFVGAKEKNRPENERGTWGRGDVWTWTALCADTKLVPCWLVGTRDAMA